MLAISEARNQCLKSEVRSPKSEIHSRLPYISFERVLRSIQQNLLLINLQNKVNKFTAVINLRGVSTNNIVL